jgi:hypothetical protein
VFLPMVSLRQNPPTYGLQCSWDHRHTSPCLTYRLRWSLASFLPWLVWNCDPPDLHLLRSWNYRRVTLTSVLMVV